LRSLIVSKYIETKAVGGPVQPDFLNSVAIGESELEPEDLLNRLLAIEDEMGRVREVKWGPRIIDLDLIVFGDHVINTQNLKLPHPLASSRDFVLTPWLSIDPDGVIPGLGKIKFLASLSRKS
jgi:2-amino-4-hydroxy-6-hydroxymethyldihydropteridine diphosphokinase